MTEDDKRVEAINEVAAKQLPMLLSDLEEAQRDEDLLPQYEIDFLGDLYARMIVSVLMGYFPNIMGHDAVEAAHRLTDIANDIAKEYVDE